MQTPTVFRIGVKYGLITSLLVIIASFIMYSTGQSNPSGNSIQLLVSIIIYSTGLYLGFDAYKKGHEGYASLGELVKISFYIALVCGVLGGIFSYIYLQYIDPQMMKNIMMEQRIQMENSGVSDEVIDQSMKAVEMVMEPGIMIPLQILISVITITFLGLIMGLVLKKNKPAFSRYMMPEKDISVVIPLYNEEESLPELSHWIDQVMQKHGYSYEIILVDDGSKDRSWEVIIQLSAQNANIKGIRLNRNYGKSAALNIGFRHSIGDVVITMDADLQDSPDEIPKLYQKIKTEGWHLVSGWKKKRYDPLSKTIPSKLFNKVTSLMSGIKLHDFNCGLKAYHHAVVKNIEVYGEMHRYIPVIAKWAGFHKISEMVVEHRARKYGVTKFGLERFIYGFLDLLSIMFVSKFRKRPMHFFGSLGTLSFIVGFAITLTLTFRKFYYSWHNIKVRNVTEQPLFFLALVALVVGVQLFLAGFLGEIMANNARKDDYVIAEII